MNRFSEFKPVQRRQRAIVVVGDIRHNVSNLCVPSYMPAVQRDKTRLGREKSRHGALSLYPSTQNLPDIPIAELCFKKANLKKTPPDSAPASDHVRLHSMLDQSKRTPDRVDDEPDNEYDRPLFEVVPGHWVDLRGAEETWSALQRNFSIVMLCPCCDTRMHVIKDAAMVLCPGCRTIVPVNDNGNGMGLGVMISEEDAPTSSQFNDNENGIGVGVVISEKDAPTSSSQKPVAKEYATAHKLSTGNRRESSSRESKLCEVTTFF